jgi:hypothetical protein
MDLKNPDVRMALKSFVEPVIPDAQEFVDKLADFVHIEANLPSSDKNFLPAEPIKITVEQSREQIIEYLQGLRESNPVADLAFYAYRDMQSCDWAPFVKAVVERNPVSIEKTKVLSVEEAYSQLEGMENVSIYDGKRLAQPDEVANYKTGDGLEKAFFLANIIRNRNPEQDIKIICDKDEVLLKDRGEYRFKSNKGLKKQVFIPGSAGTPWPDGSAAGALSISD